MTTEDRFTPLDARDAFAELGRLSLADTSMDDMLQRISELAKQVIPGVAEASVSLVTNDKATTAVYTGDLARDLDESQYGRGYGPCLEAAVGGEMREIIDAREETPWPDYARAAVDRGSLSSLSVPVPVRTTTAVAIALAVVSTPTPSANRQQGANDVGGSPRRRTASCE